MAADLTIVALQGLNFLAQNFLKFGHLLLQRCLHERGPHSMKGQQGSIFFKENSCSSSRFPKDMMEARRRNQGTCNACKALVWDPLDNLLPLFPKLRLWLP
jgi:hypothetical protein